MGEVVIKEECSFGLTTFSGMDPSMSIAPLGMENLVENFCKDQVDTDLNPIDESVIDEIESEFVSVI